MPNTNFQTIFQMPGIVNNIVKQATGRDSVSQIDMDFVTVGQDKQTVPHEIDYTAMASFVNNNQLPITVLAKITAVQSGAGDPSPENVRPITGWTGANVSRMGFNLFDKSTAQSGKSISVNGAVVSSGSYIVSDYIPVLPSTAYYVSYCVSAANGRSAFTYDADKEPIAQHYPEPYSTSATSGKMTTEASARYIRICVPDADKACLNFYDTAKNGTYEPYAGETYAITFPEAAGTVYGGTLDVTTGVLTVTMGEIESYNGETLPGVWMSDRDVYAEDATPTEGAQVVYELAVPVMYECDPEEIKSLIGSNNVWADTGDVSVSYTSYIPVP